MYYHSTKKWFVVGAMIGLLGCRTSLQEAEPTIQFSVVTPLASKSVGLSVGDQVAVYARLDGSQPYFLEHVAFTVGADGQSLTTSPAVSYPHMKQAVAFYAYFPYHTGLFSVPTDQRSAAALKQADLCWAAASTTPVPTSVPLQFDHTMARLVVATGQRPDKIAVPNALVGGSLDRSTGVFTATDRSEVSTTGGELIVPGQSISRLIVTVGGVEYVFEGSIFLPCGQTTTINLTLNPSTQTATLSGSSTTDWNDALIQGKIRSEVFNTLTFHWTPVYSRIAEANGIELSIKDETTGLTSTYTVSEQLVFVDNGWSLPFAATGLSYPYTVLKISLKKDNQLIASSERMVGGTVYKSGAYTLGVNGIPIDITLNGLRWATGCLVAANNTAGTFGPGGCTIGAPYEPGLLFVYGSLIGYATSTGSSGGRVIGSLPFVQWIRPVGCTLGTGFLPTQLSSHIPATDNPVNASGDPCRYYLGAPWRTPTPVEAGALLNISDINNLGWRTWSSVSSARWVDNGPMEGKTSGTWVGPNANSGTPTLSTDLFFAGVSTISGLTALPSNILVYPLLSQWYSGETMSLPRSIRFQKNMGVVPADVIERNFASPVRCVRPI